MYLDKCHQNKPQLNHIEDTLSPIVKTPENKLGITLSGYFKIILKLS